MEIGKLYKVSLLKHLVTHHHLYLLSCAIDSLLAEWLAELGTAPHLP